MPRLHHRLSHPLARLVNPLEQAGRDPPACGRCRATEIAQQGFKGAPGLARPLEADLTQPAVLNRMPLRAAVV